MKCKSLINIAGENYTCDNVGNHDVKVRGEAMSECTDCEEQAMNGLVSMEVLEEYRRISEWFKSQAAKLSPVGDTMHGLAAEVMDTLIDHEYSKHKIPLYGMLDLWMALYGTSHPEFDEFYAKHGYAETWALLLAEVRKSTPALYESRKMSDLKVGDRVRLSTGVEGEIVDHYGTAGFEFKAEDGNCFFSEALESLNITWELVKPELVEPPAGSVIRFRDRVAVRDPYEGIDFHWGVKDDPAVYSWQGLVHEYNITEFEVLRPEKEVVKEVLYKLQGFLNDLSYARVQKIAKEYGVELC